MGLLDVFKKIGGLLKKAWGLIEKAGLSDEVVDIAQHWVKVAEEKYVDNAQRREWIVSILKAKGINEGVARVAVELALKLAKKELDKIDGE